MKAPQNSRRGMVMSFIAGSLCLLLVVGTVRGQGDEKAKRKGDGPKRQRVEKPKGPVENAEFYGALTNVYLRYGHKDKAMETLTMALEKAQGNAEKAKLLMLKAHILVMDKKNDEAATTAQEAMKLSDSKEVTASGAEILIAAGKTDEGLAKLREVYDKNPNDKRLLGRLILAYMKAKRNDDAMALGKQLLDGAKTDAEKTEALFVMADLSRGTGDNPGAVGYLQKVKELPDMRGSHKRAEKMIERLNKPKPEKKERKPHEKKAGGQTGGQKKQKKAAEQ